MRKKVLSILFLAVIFGLTVWSVFNGENPKEIMGFLLTARPEYIALGIFCVISFILSESVIIHYLMKKLGTKVKMGHCCLYSFVGFFYSCITPSASGGQPMQVITMKKDGIPVAVSTVVLAIVTITYKLVLVVIGLVVMIFRPAHLIGHLEPVKGIIYLGIVLNVGCVWGLLMMVFKPNLVRRISHGVLGAANRIRPMKNMDRLTAGLEKIMDQYSGTADFYRTNHRVMLHVFVITLIQRMLLFAVTWFTYRAFDLEGCTMAVIVGLQAMISVAVDMLPLPGGMGVSENLFLEIFTVIFGEDFVLPGMLVSRGLSFYTQLFISAVMTFASAFIIKEKTRKARERL